MRSWRIAVLFGLALPLALAAAQVAKTSVGFKPLTGKYDYYKEWKQIPTEDEMMEAADQIFETLKGEDVHFKITSEMDR